MTELGPRLNDLIVRLLAFQRRFDPYFRDAFNAVAQRPLVTMTQFLLRLPHRRCETRLCEEVAVPDEAVIIQQIADQMARFTEREYRGRIAERAGNTKTYGVVRAEFEVLSGFSERMRRGVFAAPRTFPAWVRFAGPGPLSPPDIEDAGILSIGVKLLGVPGPKLLSHETGTQDFLGISAPTFTTPDIVENVKLQRAIFARTPVFYFLNPFDSHYLDMIMQGLYARMNSSPLEVRYWSCVPYLLGEGQAMKYSIRPTSRARTRVPWNPPDDWLREAMARTLSQRDVELEFLVQLQTDVSRMPIEDASIEWPERLSPFVRVARLRIPKQDFDSPEQRRFARQLSFNPWHAIPEHRPLGNQNRARRAIYAQLSKLRQSMNAEPHVEPTA